MIKPNERFHDTNTDKTDFQTRFDAVTGHALTPENINNYADDALNELIKIVEDIVSTYAESHELSVDGADAERVALSHFGLSSGEIEATLNHIADLSDGIKSLDAFIEAHANNGTTIITPPTKLNSPDIPNGGTFNHNGVIPRLKTVLALLKYHFDIDIEDESQLAITPGNVESDMMRRTPYNLVDIPTLNRMINLCDEEGNRTFVFDRGKILDIGLSAEDLALMEKPELDRLIVEGNNIGQSIVYGPNFLARVKDAISLSVTAGSQEVSLLNPIFEKLPEGAVTFADFAATYNVTVLTLKAWCSSHSEVLGQIRQAKSPKSGHPMYILLEDQAACLTEILNEKLKDIVDELPEGYITTRQYAQEKKLTESAINTYVRDSIGELGEVLRLRRPKARKPIKILSPEQKLILDEKYGDRFEDTVDGEKTVDEFAKEVNTTPNAVHIWIANDRSELGTIKRGKRQAILLTPEQQQFLIEKHGIKEDVVLDRIPEGSITLRELSERLSLSTQHTRRFIREFNKSHDGSLGPVLKVKQNGPGVPESVFNKAQVDTLISSWIESRPKNLVYEMPAGYEKIRDFSDRTGVRIANLQKWIVKFSKELGEVKKLKLKRGRDTTILSPDQQNFLVELDRKRAQRFGKSVVDRT